MKKDIEPKRFYKVRYSLIEIKEESQIFATNEKILSFDELNIFKKNLKKESYRYTYKQMGKRGATIITFSKLDEKNLVGHYSIFRIL